jgi:hypothetical protein
MWQLASSDDWGFATVLRRVLRRVLRNEHFSQPARREPFGLRHNVFWLVLCQQQQNILEVLLGFL